ncbi:MAG: patatin-like phospholipase family protein, partial [Ignavibacteriaceae bacterium]
SGGGARGIAQVGVLKAFEENNIPIDILVGTSMGSVIGGLYAAGYSMDEIDSIARNTDWDYILSLDRETNRRELFIDQKITEDKAIFALRLKGLTPVLPTSINDGQKLSNYLNLLTLQAPIHVEESFDELKVKFRAVCTNLVNGNLVVINSGSLSHAMRASSSVSFFLSPVKMDSLILVDGGLVANIPVKVASEMGGEYIIAVNTTSNLHEIEELESPWMVADQIVSIPMLQLNRAQLEGASIVIEPGLNDKQSTDFTNLDSLIDAGYNTALKYIGKIKYQIDSLLHNNLKEKEFFIRNVLLDNSDVLPENNLKKKYSLKDSVSSYDILSDMYTLFETGRYEDITVFVSQSGSYSTLDFVYEEKPTVNKVMFSGISAVKRETADSILTSVEGKYYDHEIIAARIVDVLKLYRDRGYSLAELKRMHFDKSDSTLFLEFSEGIIDSIIIEGNYYTNITIITREFNLRSGNYFYYNDVERGLRNLRNTNLFEDIILTVSKDSNGKNIVVLKVMEKVSSLVRVGFRSDNEDKLQVSLDFRDENLFGSATELGLLLSLGPRKRAYILEHKSNRIFNTYLTYKINAYYRFDDAFEYATDPITSERKFSRSSVGEYRQIYYGASVAAGWQVQRFGNLIFQGKYGYDEVKVKTGSPGFDPYKIKIVSLKVSSTIDTQDKYPYPENGIYFYGSYETAQKILGGDIGFSNIGFEYKNYFTLNGGHTLSPRIVMGFGDKTLPLSQHYSLGGQSSFFGMREDEFRGRQLFLTSLEYRYQLPISIFFTTFFKFRYDLGSAWAEQEEIRFKDLRHGAGASLSFDTPIGPADFSVGKSFLFTKNLPGNPISWGETQYYFSIGFFY